MTPGARVQAAIELLDEILGGAPAERVITGWARRSRFAGSKDRAAVRDLVFQALRCLRSYACLGGATTGRGIMIGALREAGGDLEEVFCGKGHAPEALSDVERSAGAAPSEPEAEFDLQEWLIPFFINSLRGEDKAHETAQMLRQRAPVMLRVNRRKTSLEQALAALAEHGVRAEPASIATTALKVTEGARRVATSSAYLEGLVELQDGSSQAAMEMLQIPSGGKVLDYCAGGGGKVLALAARADATWVAHDAAPQRLKDLPARAARAGVEVSLCETDDLPRSDFDLVLCDVPCSGSGTWRRTPDAKWRLTGTDLERLNQTQGKILDDAAQLVAEGGRLAYATCSVLSCENEDQVSAFVNRNGAWQVDFMQRWSVSDAGDGFFLTQLSQA